MLAGVVTATAVALLSVGGLYTSVAAVAPAPAPWSWGSNAYGQLGGGGPTTATPAAIALPSGLTLTAVAAGFSHSLAVTADGKVLAWGANRWGQLGNGTTTTTGCQCLSDPVQTILPAGVTATAVSGGSDFSLALTSTGKVLAWGFNGFGELGTGTTTSNGCNCLSTPVEVALPPGTVVTAIAAGSNHSLALTSTGQVFGWGDNYAGELGTGSTTTTACSCLPTPALATTLSGISPTAIAAGSGFSLALATSGSVLAWGQNQTGQLGNGSTTASTCSCLTTPGPVALPPGTVIAAIAAGGGHGVGLSAAGKVFSWGFNYYGQMGTGSTTATGCQCIATPISATLPAATNVAAISAGGRHTLAVTSGGQVLGWGENDYGEVGAGAVTVSGCFCIATPTLASFPPGTSIAAVAAGGTHSLGLPPHGGTPPPPSPAVFYFAEGFTGPGFDEFLYLLSPVADGAATVDFYAGETHFGPFSVALTHGQVATVHANDLVPANLSISAVVTMPGQGVAERVLRFDTGRWHGSTDQVGTAAPNTDWAFAEGSTSPGFDEYLTLQNPGSTAVATSLAYFTTDGRQPVKSLVLGPRSRTTIPVFVGDLTTDPACATSGGGCGVGRNLDVSVRVHAAAPIIAERPMYVNNFSFGSGTISDGHDVFGANVASLNWNFAEGYTGPGFDEYLTLLNPGADQDLALTYLFTSSPAKVVHHQINAGSRLTIHVNDPSEAGPNQSVSVQVVAGGSPIFAERPMYMVADFGSGIVRGAHDVIGAAAGGRLFAFASASSGPGEHDYLTVENPGSAATLTLTYFVPGGPLTRTLATPGHSRATVDLSSSDLGGPGPGYPLFGIQVSSDQPVIVEKPTYGSAPGAYGATDAIGYTPPGGSF